MKTKKTGHVAFYLGVLGLLCSLQVKGQYLVNECEWVNDTMVVAESLLHVQAGATFINRGTIYYRGVTSLVNHGGFSEEGGACSARYTEPCTQTPGTQGLHIFSSDQTQTTLGGSNPLRMYAVSLSRSIVLENEWQIVHTLDWQRGMITSDKTVPTRRLRWLGGSITGTGASDTCHVNGYAAWSGNGSFELPVGDGSNLQPVGLVGSTSCTIFSAAYFSGDPGSATLPAGAPFLTATKGTGVGIVSQEEYWDVDGADSTRITLHFDTLSNLSAIAGSLLDIIVVGWDGSKWVNLGNTATTGLFTGNGTVTSQTLLPDDFTAFTFASACSASPGQLLPNFCINTALTSIKHTTTVATGIGTPTGLPPGVTATWAGDTISISGTPSSAGTYQYRIPLTGGSCSGSATGTITIAPNNTAGTASSTPSICIQTSLTPVTLPTTGATGIGSATGLPAGVSAVWASDTITLIGTPSVAGSFNYHIPLTGGCGNTAATGILTVRANNVANAATGSPTACLQTALTPFTHLTTGATGIGAASGLPPGVLASWANDRITISGTPSVAGVFTYTIPLTGGCGNTNATGTIQVILNNTSGTASATPQLCAQTPLTPITHLTTGAIGIGLPVGLPSGVTAIWSANTITISGTPANSGTFNYSIPLTGGCGSIQATGTITVLSNPVGQIAVTGSDVLCSPGNVVLQASGGSSYRWSTGEQTAQINRLIQTDTEFRVTITNASGCSNTATKRISIAAPLQVTAIISPTCIGGSTGHIDLTVQGGGGSYIFRWSDNSTSEDVSDLSPGIYVVDVIDNNKCITNKSFEITGNLAPPVLDIQIPDAVCEGSTANIVLLPSQAMEIRYQAGKSNLQIIKSLANSIPIKLNNLLENTEFQIHSAISLATGCSIEPQSIQKTIEVWKAPSVEADNISVCSDEPFQLSIRTKTSTPSPITVEWKAEYAGALGGQKNGILTDGEYISEILRNTSSLPVAAVYTLTPYSQHANTRCAGVDYRARVQIQPLPTLSPVPPMDVCSGTPFTINLQTLNAANPSISWKRLNQSVEGAGSISDVLFNSKSILEEVIYAAHVTSNGCSSPVLQIPVRVHALPTLNINSPEDVCDGFIDLTSSALIEGSSGGIRSGYWHDRNLSRPVSNPAHAVSGLYFISIQDAIGCTNAAPIIVQTAVYLKVNKPAPVCQGVGTNLTDAKVTAGSDEELQFTYWLDEGATQPLLNPQSAKTGRYYIKGQPKNSDCFAIQPVEVVALQPRLLNQADLFSVCTGNAFTFKPETNLPGTTFNWQRPAVTGVHNSPANGIGSIDETLLSSVEQPVRLSYTFRLQAPGCALASETTDTLFVELLPSPIISLTDSISTCAPKLNLNDLVQNPGRHTLSFSLDQEGKSQVLNPTAALAGKYFVRATDAAGCSQTHPLTILSRIGAPVVLDTVLEFCPPNQADLVAFVRSRNTLAKFSITYFEDIEGTIPQKDPTHAGEGTYYLQLRDTVRANAGCFTILPLKAQLGIASMDSPLEVAPHCGGTLFEYTPNSRQKGVTFKWELLTDVVRDTLQGTGNIATLLQNQSDSVQTAHFRITASRSVCPKQPNSLYLLEVKVRPRPTLMPLESIYSIQSGDSLRIPAMLQPPVAAARLNWDAAYGAVQGGIGKGRNVQFTDRTIAEQLYNFTDSTVFVPYKLTPVLPGSPTCTGDTIQFVAAVGSRQANQQASLAGAVSTRRGTSVEDVEIALSGRARIQHFFTNASGKYQITRLKSGYDYTLVPSLDTDPLNGISTRDLIVLQQHLLGIKTIQDPYDLIAADINRSKNISLADLLALRRLLLGMDGKFLHNTSWRFIDQRYQFPSPKNPWIETFPEWCNFNNLSGLQTAHFTAVKIGDLSGDASTHSNLSSIGRSNNALKVEATGGIVKAGQQLVLPLRSNGTEKWDGCQFTLSYDPRFLQLLPGDYGIDKPVSVGLFPEEGLITCAVGKIVLSGDTLLMLPFVVKKDGSLESMLSINSRITQAEGYQGDQTFPLEITWIQPTEMERPYILQNYPNPFEGETNLPFWLPREELIRLRIFDGVGRIIFEQEQLTPAGFHTLKVKAAALGDSNTWFYQISGKDWLETRKMYKF